MRRFFATMILSLGAAALLASPAWAQNRGFGRGAGALMMLTNPGVHKELKLDSEQTEKVKGIAKTIQEKHADDFEKLRGLEAAERREKMTELGKTITAEVNKALADVLKPEQIKRFHQIRLQVVGLQAFSEPKVQEKLSLNDEQKDKIKDLEEESRGKMREIFQSAGDNREEAMKKLTAYRKETMEKAVALLSSEQKSTWKELTGEPFEFVFQRPGN